IEERTPRSRAGIVDHKVRRTDLALDKAEQAFDIVRFRGITGIGPRASLMAERPEFLASARGKRDADVFAGEQAGARGAQPFAGADNECDFVRRYFHGGAVLPMSMRICIWGGKGARQPAPSSTGSRAALSATARCLTTTGGMIGISRPFSGFARKSRLRKIH